VDFADLAARVGDRLLDVQPSPLANMRNPYAIQEDPGGFQTTGWFEAFESRHSPRAVTAESAADVAAAVDFARDCGVGLVIKGAGHDYLGRSSAPESLLIWTHRMREVTVHDAFRPAGTDGPGVPAISVGAGTRWLEAYQAAAGHGRYVQGGGCVTVGAAGGFPQGGGFGSFSRRYGTAAGNVLEAEVVLASGEIVVANEARHPDLFWALRGGGGGTFGVVTRLTMRTYPIPETRITVRGAIRASGDAEFRRLLTELARFLPGLCNDRWGEQVMLSGDNSVEFGMHAVDLADEEARRVWRPFLDWVDEQPSAFTSAVSNDTVPFGVLWDAGLRDQLSHAGCHGGCSTTRTPWPTRFSRHPDTGRSSSMSTRPCPGRRPTPWPGTAARRSTRRCSTRRPWRSPPRGSSTRFPGYRATSQTRKTPRSARAWSARPWRCCARPPRGPGAT